MPELPEVEVFRHFVEEYALNKNVTAVEILKPKILQKTTPDALKSAVEGHPFIRAERRGKHLLLEVGKKGPWVFMHFGLTGYLSWTKNGQTLVNAYGDPDRPEDHVRVRFDFADGSELNFHEMRMFGKLGLADSLEEYVSRNKLGPDALAVDEKTFHERLLAKAKGQIKPVLMDQAVFAGIGNVYADEMLYQCRVHPEKRISEIDPKTLKCLYQQMVEVLQKTVDCNADRTCLPKGYLLHTRHKNAQCPRDGEKIHIKEVGGRTTYFCPKCQEE